jgi:uracil-DNA glycosylase
VLSSGNQRVEAFGLQGHRRGTLDARAILTRRALAGSRRIDEIRARAAECRQCDLWERASQTVFGEGPVPAGAMFVGEQPGDTEDREGRPFVGPAGRLLDEALEAAHIPRHAVYVTNAVKHFKWQPRGKRRLHSRPNQGEVSACHPWLESEIGVVRPKVIVCLGAIAAQALLGPRVRVTRDRGAPLPSSLAPFVFVTVHPSSLLRTPDPEARRAAMKQFVADLDAVRKVLEG